MRRSGVGAIRESTLRPMSKSEAANLHASQVPPGIPVTAVDSDEEGASAEGFPGSAKSTDGSRRTSAISGNAHATSSREPLGRANNLAEPPAGIKALGGKLNRLGVTTPPLSDESHARAAAARQHANTADSDSDESETMLPWARASTSSNKSATSTDNALGGTASGAGVRTDSRRQSLARGALPGRVVLNMSNTLPPSPISSAESPLNSKGGDHAIPPSASGSFEGVVPRIREPRMGHTPNQSSISTMTTSESEEDGRRQDHALSIYEVYGRDSVAFPNFDFRVLNGKTSSLGARMVPSKSSESLSASRSTPNSPLMRSDSRGQMPVALRTPSHRRPTAAPPVPTSSISASLRRKAEANGDARSDGSNSTGPAGAFGTFDPRRRPSMGNLNGVRNAAARGPMSPSSDGRSTGNSDLQGIPPMPAADEQRSSGRPIGSNLLARRMHDAGGQAPANDGQTPIPMRIDTNVNSANNTQQGRLASPDVASPNKPFAKAVEGALPSPSAATYRPARSSSDRTSHRERIGSGQLKKNPSNPQPGPHGGMSALMIPQSSTGGLSTPSRSPSPLSATSPSGSMMRPISPSGTLSASPSNGSGAPAPSPSRAPGSVQGVPSSPLGPPRMMQVSPAPYQNINPANVSFDSFGFVIGSSPPISMPREDPEDLKFWRQLLSENDMTAAKKSRKVKKMAQKGIPHSMRATVWPFLANAYIRRRPGLFEELCKMSLSAKGKKGKETLYDAIDKDLDRAYPDHRLFMGSQSTGMADLEAILKAYVHYNPIVGYTQGMNLVAGFLLIQMPAEDAFWLMCALLRDVHMEGYYSGDMKQLHVDGIVFGQLLQSMDPDLAARLIELNVEPINFAPNWLLPLFARILPWQTLLRAWDVFFFEGPSCILRVALAIIRILRDPLMDRRVCPGPGEALRLLLHPPQHLLTPDNVIPCAISVKLKDGDVRKLSRQASKLVRNTVMNPSGRGRSSVSGASVSRSVSAPAAKRPHAT